MSNLCICTTQCLPDAQPQKLLKIFVKRGQRAKTLDSILAAVVNVSIHSGNKKKCRYKKMTRMKMFWTRLHQPCALQVPHVLRCESIKLRFST